MASLVGDPERDRATKELQRQYLEGRLSLDELAGRLETALHARNGSQLRSALNELPGRWTDPDVMRGAMRSPVRAVRNAAILVATGIAWLFWNAAVLVAFVVWVASNGASLGAFLVFPLVWFAVSWLLWSTGKRRRAR